jgi:CheY-like chemotaxis protein
VEQRTSGPTILLVDDDDAVRRLGVRVLERAGFDVRSATTAAGGLQIFETPGVDVALLIVDVNLGGDSGGALAARLRVRRPSLPVLIVSGSDDPSEPGASDPGDEFLAKPFTSAGLIEAVRRLLERP